MKAVAKNAIFAASGEAAIAVEDDSGDTNRVNGVGGPAVEGVGNDAVGAAVEEELGEGASEDGGIDEGWGRHVGGGDGVEVFTGRKLEGLEVDIEAGLSVSVDGPVEDDGVVGNGDDGGFNAVSCK